MSYGRRDQWAERESDLRSTAMLIVLGLAVLETIAFFSLFHIIGIPGWWAAFWIPIVIGGLVSNWITAVIVVRFWFVREERERDSNAQLHAIRTALQGDRVPEPPQPARSNPSRRKDEQDDDTKDFGQQANHGKFPRRQLADIVGAQMVRDLPKIQPSRRADRDDDTKDLTGPLP